MPAIHRVAAFAVRVHLMTMNVGMAIGTALAHILEYQACMALAACHLPVHSAQRIAGLVVIEFGVGANRFPAGIRVAVLTRNRDRSVRIGHLRLRTTYFRPRLFIGKHDVLADDNGRQTNGDKH